VVAIRWMSVVSTSRSPSRAAAVDAADSRSQGMAEGSTVTLASTLPTTLLPSLAGLLVQPVGLNWTMAEPQPTPWTQTFWTPGMSGAMSFWETISWA
jgi:hypothetical protein